MTRPMVLLRSTYGSQEDAVTAARRLLEARLACCVHVVPIRSLYHWQGEVVDEAEWSLEARTTPERRETVWSALLEGHPYDTPLVEHVADTQVPDAYAGWAHDCVG